MNTTIRRLQIDEIPTIGQIDKSDVVDAQYVCRGQPDGLGLFLKCVKVDPPEEEPNWGEIELADRYALWRRNYEEEGAVFIGAFVDNTIVGICAVVKLKDRRTAEIYTLQVDKDHRKQGLGTTLLARAESQCTTWGCLQLFTYTTFKASSLDFYRSKGYRIVGIQDPAVTTKNFAVTVAKQLDQNN
jgi:GNAT superfamily N-acetyltransferase